MTYEADQIVIAAFVAPLPADAYNCPGNDSVTVTVQLSEPVGRRQLIDGACLEGEAVITSFCSDGAMRWSP